MDFTIIQGLIGSFGFPIVCAIAMFWYSYKTQEKFQAQLESLTKSHKEEMKQMSEAINNNTNIMTKLLERLER